MRSNHAGFPDVPCLLLFLPRTPRGSFRPLLGGSLGPPGATAAPLCALCIWPTARVKPRAGRRKPRLCSQATGTHRHLEPGPCGSLWSDLMVCTDLACRTVSSLAGERMRHATAPPTPRRTGEHGGGRLPVELNAARRAERGWLAPRMAREGQGTESTDAALHRPGTRDRPLLHPLHPLPAVPPQAYSFPALSHPSSRYRNEAIARFSSGRPSRVGADYKISGSKFSPSWHILKMLMTPSASRFQG